MTFEAAATAPTPASLESRFSVLKSPLIPDSVVVFAVVLLLRVLVGISIQQVRELFVGSERRSAFNFLVLRGFSGFLAFDSGQQFSL